MHIAICFIIGTGALDCQPLNMSGREISISNKIYSKLRQNLLFTSVPLGRDTTKAFVGHNLSILKQLIDVGNQIRDMIPFRLSVLVQRLREFAGRNLRYPAHAVVAHIPILVLIILLYVVQNLTTCCNISGQKLNPNPSRHFCTRLLCIHFWWPCCKEHTHINAF